MYMSTVDDKIFSPSWKISKEMIRWEIVYYVKVYNTHTDRQRHVKSPSFLMTWEIPLFILCTSVVVKSPTKDFHSRFIPQIKHWQFLKVFFPNFILRNCQTFSISARSSLSILWFAFKLSDTFYVCLESLSSCSYQIVKSTPELCHAYKYHTWIQYWSSAWNKRCEQNLN